LAAYPYNREKPEQIRPLTPAFHDMLTADPNSTPTPKPTPIRADIQALRGIAILLVVFYHAGFSGLSGGYLGVDIFFVVSGFLITGLLTRAMDAGTFSALDFYWRRTKRLLPAALAVFFICSVAAPYWLTQTELRSFTRQLLGALLASGNMVLWLQQGYFDTASQMKPLLHTWSLGIEEQFYLVMPWLLLWLAPRWRLLALLTGTVFSLGLCWLIETNDADTAFYLLPTRAWELSIGAVVATLPQRKLPSWCVALDWLAVLLIAAIVGFPIDFSYMSLNALVACLATAWLILNAPTFLSNNLASRWLGRVGDISYSLYLVHWPLLAFAHNYYAGEPLPMLLVVQLLVASLLAALLLHFAIEQPCRRSTVRPPRFALAAFAVLLLTLVPLASHAAAPVITDWETERLPVVGLHDHCIFDGSFQAKSECISKTPPTVLVWGDSIAMLWAKPLASKGVAQATMSTCGPLVGVSPIYSKELGRPWALRCLAFNDVVLAWLKTQPTITQVVLSARFTFYVEVGQRLLTRDGPLQQNINNAAKALIATINSVEALGKQVILIAPPPMATFDVGICLERKASGLPLAGRPNCDIAYADYQATDKDVIALLKKIEQDTGVTVLWPADALCDSQTCRTTWDDAPIYRDKSHLSARGVTIFAEHFELEKKVFGE
jgi:peptidoglycan/LPS O-acetylase OafA/YrhL